MCECVRTHYAIWSLALRIWKEASGVRVKSEEWRVMEIRIEIEGERKWRNEMRKQNKKEAGAQCQTLELWVMVSLKSKSNPVYWISIWVWKYRWEMSTPTFQKNASRFNSICNSNIDQKNFGWFIILSLARQLASTHTRLLCIRLNHFYICVCRIMIVGLKMMKKMWKWTVKRMWNMNSLCNCV